MSNAELIAEARSVVGWNVADEYTGPTDSLLERLADALEQLEKELAEGRAEAWDTGFEDCATWMNHNPPPSGIWSDPPQNPHRA